MLNDVVITGMGVLTSVGDDRDSFAFALRSGACGITRDNQDGLGVAARVGGFRLDERLTRLELPEEIFLRARKAGHRAPVSIQLSILTALEAWTQAFGRGAGFSQTAVNLIVAGNNVSPGYAYRIHEQYAQTREFIPASYALHFLDTDHVGVVSEVLGLQSEGFTAGGASASGNVAILQAWRQIRHGIANACVVVGAMTDLSPMELQSFRNAGALGGLRFEEEPERACRPFDRDREGFIYGQGSACLVLESAEFARRRGAHVLGGIAGAGFCLDANRLSHPSVEGEARAMRLALGEAGLAPEAVDYVNAHATSSKAGDEAEVKALKEVFGAHVRDLKINGTKGLTGHCLHAAGVVEAAATLIQMNGRFLHPNRNLECPMDDTCGFAGASAQEADMEIVMSNAFGFGGINTSIVMKPYRF